VDTPGARVSRTEITLGVVGKARIRGLFGGLALPGAVGALRRDQDPLAEEGIVAAMRNEIEGSGCSEQRGPLEVEMQRFQVYAKCKCNMRGFLPFTSLRVRMTNFIGVTETEALQRSQRDQRVSTVAWVMAEAAMRWLARQARP